MLNEKPNVMYWRHDIGVHELLKGLESIEPGETVGLACMYVRPNGMVDRRVAAAYVIADGRYFDVYGTGRLSHIVCWYLGVFVPKWAVRVHISEDAPEPDYYV